MNQVPMMTYPTPAMAQPAQQPNYNAVKIDIINPSVGTPGCNSQYAQPTMPYYSYPQQQVYNYPQAPQQPYYPPVATMPYPAAPAPQQIPVAQEVPAAVECPVGQVPVCAPVEQPAAVQNKVADQQNVQQQNINVPPVVPQPQVSEPTVVNNAAPKEQPEVVNSETIAPQVDMNSFIAKLSNPDFEVQAAAMEDIANMVKDAPDKATELVDTKIFDSLANILSFSSEGLEGPTAEQIAAREKMIEGKEVTKEEQDLANTMSPKELAERNKSYALYTTAILQKLYCDEVAKLTGQVLPLTELPNAVAVVDNLKDNPNPMVRGSAIEALSYLQRPEYQKDLQTVFSIAQNDVDPRVAQTAKVALEKLAQA